MMPRANIDKHDARGARKNTHMAEAGYNLTISVESKHDDSSILTA